MNFAGLANYDLLDLVKPQRYSLRTCYVNSYYVQWNKPSYRNKWDCTILTDTPPQKHTNLTDILESVGIQNIDPNSTVILSTPPQLNGTYKKGSKVFTPLKSAMSLSNDSLNRDTLVNNGTPANATFNRLELRARKSQRNSVLGSAEINLNNTVTLDNYHSKHQNLSYEDVDHRTALKRNSFGYSAGSADSLDRMSSLSNGSSKGSNRMLNMAEVDAIVEMQEQSEWFFICWLPFFQPFFSFATDVLKKIWTSVIMFTKNLKF